MTEQNKNMSQPASEPARQMTAGPMDKPADPMAQAAQPGNKAGETDWESGEKDAVRDERENRRNLLNENIGED